MQDSILVRPITIEDFQFVRDLAAEQQNFTIPPPYVLWLLSRVEGQVCLIATSVSGVPLGYLLAVRVEVPSHSVFVWQLASINGRPGVDAATSLLLNLRNYAKCRRVERIVFSAIPESASFRVIKKHCQDVFSALPKEIGSLPRIIAPGEHEYVLDLNLP